MSEALTSQQIDDALGGFHESLDAAGILTPEQAIQAEPAVPRPLFEDVRQAAYGNGLSVGPDGIILAKPGQANLLPPGTRGLASYKHGSTVTTAPCIIIGSGRVGVLPAHPTDPHSPAFDTVTHTLLETAYTDLSRDLGGQSEHAVASNGHETGNPAVGGHALVAATFTLEASGIKGPHDFVHTLRGDDIPGGQPRSFGQNFATGGHRDFAVGRHDVLRVRFAAIPANAAVIRAAEGHQYDPSVPLLGGADMTSSARSLGLAAAAAISRAQADIAPPVNYEQNFADMGAAT